MKDLVIRELEVKDYKNLIKLWEKVGLPYKPKGRNGIHKTRRYFLFHKEKKPRCIECLKINSVMIL